MTAFNSRCDASGRSSLRVLALLGTALSGLASPAHAEKVVFNGSGDYAVTRTDTLTDSAPVVDIRTTNGSLDLEFGDLNVTNNSGGFAAGLFGQVTGTGNIAIRTKALTTSGTGQTYGISARAPSGNITIKSDSTSSTDIGIAAAGGSGTIDVTSGKTTSGTFAIVTTATTGSTLINSDAAFGSAGIVASSTTGAISIKSETATGSNGSFTRLVTPPPYYAADPFAGAAPIDNSPYTITTILGGIDARSMSGAVSINAGTTIATGQNQSAIVALSRGNIDVVSTTATSSSHFGIFAGVYDAFGPNLFLSDLPANTVTVDSGTASTSGNSYALYAQGGTVKITSGTATQSTGQNSSFGAAIGARAGVGGLSLTSGTATSNTFSNFVITASSQGAATVHSGTINATSGRGEESIAGGLAASANGTLTINSGNINLVGAGIGISANNGNAALSINSGTITAPVGTGISATSSGSGVLTINSDSISARSGIQATSYSYFGGAPGAIVVTSREITTTGGIGIGAASAGAVKIDSTSIKGIGSGIGASASNDLTITSGTVDVSAKYGVEGISAFTNSLGKLTINSGSVSVKTTDPTAYGGVGINATSYGSGSIGITSGSVVAAGRNIQGIRAASYTGSISVVSDSVASNDTAIRLTSTSGAISVASGTTTGAASGSRGIDVASTSGDQTIVSTSATGDQRGIFTGFTSGVTTITSTTATATGANNPNAIVAQGGTVNLTSGTAANSNAAAVNGAAIFVNAGAGGATVKSGTASSLGSGTWGVEVHSAGAANVTAGTSTAANGHAVYVDAASAATVDAANSMAGGDGFSAVSVTGGTGVKLNVASASSTGANIVTDDGTRRSDTVFASATNGAIDATIGSATATGNGADAVRLIANGSGGAATVNVTGEVSSVSGHGIFLDPPGEVVVKVAAGGNVSGGLAGLNVKSATGNSIENAGRIAKSGTTAGAAIVAAGKTSLVNSGTIAGIGDTAVSLGATDDVVTLRTGSSVAGAIVGGGGTDVANLQGTLQTASALQSMARFSGFGTLNVQSGYWTASDAASAFNMVNLASSAALELTNSGAGLSGVSTGSIVNNGTLVVRSTGSGTSGTFGSTTISGAGGLALVGNGTVVVDNANLTHTGGTRIDSGSTLLLTGSLGSDIVTNAGGTFQLGNGGTSGTFTGNLVNNGTFDFNRSDDYTMAGAMSGTGDLIKRGDGKLTFGGPYSFSGTTAVLGGSIKIAGKLSENTKFDLASGQVDLSGTTQTVAALAGSSAAARLNIGGGALTVNQTANTSFAGAIVGDGGFTKSGSGTLNLTGISTYTGPTLVTGGTLAVNGRIASPVTVQSGARVGGNGTIGGLAVSTQAAAAPGNSIGTLNVAGNVAFGAGSTYEVETNADGRADRIVATGAVTLSGGTVTVLPEAGSYGKVTDYNILTAASVTGQFADVMSSNATLVPYLSYGATGVTLTLARVDLSFGAIATSANQLAAANAVQARGRGNALFDRIIRLPDAAAGRAAFDALSGEIYASLPSALIDQSRLVRGAILDRSAASADEGVAIWGQGFDSAAEADRQLGVAAVDADRKGLIAGADYGRDGWRVGFAAGLSGADVDVDARASTADVDTKLVGAYGSFGRGRLVASVGGAYEWHDIDARRTIAITGLAGAQTASFDGTTGQLFGDVSYELLSGPLTLSPFAGLAYVRTELDALSETGTAAALSVAGQTRDATFATLGLRIGGLAPISARARFLPSFSAAWRHGWGDLEAASTATFAGAATGFGIAGSKLGRNGIDLDGGFDIEIGQSLRIGARYAMSSAGDWADHGARVTLGWAF